MLQVKLADLIPGVNDLLMDHQKMKNNKEIGKLITFVRN